MPKFVIKMLMQFVRFCLMNNRVQNYIIKNWVLVNASSCFGVIELFLFAWQWRRLPVIFLCLRLSSGFFSASRERWCKPAESWFCTFLLPCRFLSRASLGKIKGRGRPWGEGLQENTHTHTHILTCTQKHTQASHLQNTSRCRLSDAAYMWLSRCL